MTNEQIAQETAEGFFYSNIDDFNAGEDEELYIWEPFEHMSHDEIKTVVENLKETIMGILPSNPTPDEDGMFQTRQTGTLLQEGF